MGSLGAAMPKADASEAEGVFRVLILGDGNFSFTLALARHLWHPQHPSIPARLQTATSALSSLAQAPLLSVAQRYLGLPPDYEAERVHVLATSFDTREQLHAKYGDSKDILGALESEPRFMGRLELRHGVNAWELAEHLGSEAGNGYDLILWNHPHLGTEDFRLHRFLMAHFFDSVSRVLRRPTSSDTPPVAADGSWNPTAGGRVRVSLVQGQELRWDVARQAQRSGLGLESVVWFDESLWPGYVVKRNKHGGSFKNVHTKRHVRTDMRSTFLTFWFDDERSAKGLDPNELPEVHARVLADLGSKSACDPSGAASIMAPLMRLSDQLRIEHVENQKQQHQQDQQDQDSTEAQMESLSLADSPSESTANRGKAKSSRARAIQKPSRKQQRAAAVPADMICPHCGKQLTSARAYQQHVHMVHELHLFGQDWQPERPRVHACKLCRKTFASSDDLWQHEISKHTSIDPADLPSAPDNLHLAAGMAGDDTETDSATAAESDYDYVPCKVCGQAVVRREWGMLLHLESLKPALGLDMCCPLCHKTFIEQRALYQHYKFCRQTRGMRAAAAERAATGPAEAEAGAAAVAEAETLASPP